MTLLITGARVIDAAGERTGDIRITDGSTASVGDGPGITATVIGEARTRRA